MAGLAIALPNYGVVFASVLALAHRVGYSLEPGDIMNNDPSDRQGSNSENDTNRSFVKKTKLPPKKSNRINPLIWINYAILFTALIGLVAFSIRIFLNSDEKNNFSSIGSQDSLIVKDRTLRSNSSEEFRAIQKMDIDQLYLAYTSEGLKENTPPAPKLLAIFSRMSEIAPDDKRTIESKRELIAHYLHLTQLARKKENLLEAEAFFTMASNLRLGKPIYSQ